MDFTNLKNSDPDIYNVVMEEKERQQSHIELIASENFVTESVMEAMGSYLTNKYAEGYPGKRYYGGCSVVDVAENIARDRLCKLFGADHANVQPHSGANANIGVYFSFLKPGDKVLGMNLSEGGHLTHGSSVNISGTYFDFAAYGVSKETETIDYDEVMEKYDKMMDWLVDIYVNTLNLIQYMHDKYYYEAAELSLMDTDLKRTFATGIAGFSHVIDSLSAIKYAKVKVIRDENGIAKDFEIEGDFPRYGNDDDRADDIGVWLLQTFMDKLKKHHTYRDSEPTTSILTITSNVVYGKATGAMPDGRKAGEPLSPGANPSYGAEKSGLLASLNSLTKIPYEWALDGISNTQTINPGALGNEEGERIENLVNVMDGYFDQGAHHLNVNVFGKEKLIDAMEHPEKEEYANFTIRVSGYAVKFIDLTKEQQMDVIARTCHDHM